MASEKWNDYADGVVELAGGIEARFTVRGPSRERLKAVVKMFDQHGKPTGDWRGISVTEQEATSLFTEGLALDIVAAMDEVRKGAEAERIAQEQEAVRRELAEAEAKALALAERAKRLGINPDIMAGRKLA